MHTDFNIQTAMNVSVLVSDSVHRMDTMLYVALQDGVLLQRDVCPRLIAI